MMRSRIVQLQFILFFLAMSACVNPPAATPAVEESQDGFQLTSDAFGEGEIIPTRYTYAMSNQCSGENYSPSLRWSGAPAGTQSFALTVVDPDGGNWVHWVLFNIPAQASGLDEAIAGLGTGTPGKNSYGAAGWGGPCPPSGTHRYVFTLTALDTTLELADNASLDDLMRAMQGHILAQAQLTGLRSK